METSFLCSSFHAPVMMSAYAIRFVNKKYWLVQNYSWTKHDEIFSTRLSSELHDKWKQKLHLPNYNKLLTAKVCNFN